MVEAMTNTPRSQGQGILFGTQFCFKTRTGRCRLQKNQLTPFLANRSEDMPDVVAKPWSQQSLIWQFRETRSPFYKSPIWP
jgi:hypothetical protein